MNKKLIEQLGLQADNWAKDNYIWTPDGTNWYDVYTAKLTELIVRECLLAISHTPIESDEIGTMVRCHNQVKQHFGVEE